MKCPNCSTEHTRRSHLCALCYEAASPGHCGITGCGRPTRSGRLCGMHVQRIQAHGDPHFVMRHRGDRTAAFWSKTAKAAPTDCWLWTGGINASGYVTFYVGDKHWLAHRYAYQLLVAPIPPGYEIDHVHARGCRNRNCVNPAHLEAVTQAENKRRSNALRKKVSR